MAEILDGKALAKELNSSLKNEVEGLEKNGLVPKLTVILVGNDPASAVYVRNKERASGRIGIKGVVERYDSTLSERDLLRRIDELNRDNENHGILVQLPLPSHINKDKVLLAIDPDKDVDGFHPVNVGKLVTGSKALRPCTPSGIMHLIDSTNIKIEGMNATVVGRSNIVGKPTAIMLLERNATVTITHSKTRDLPGIIKNSDIVIAAIGRAEFIKGSWLKKGAIVIDVGMNKTDNDKLVGDVEFDEAKKVAGYITPVPGGVGPMTIAMLMKNTVTAAKRLRTSDR